jgi:hypothetical protein
VGVHGALPGDVVGAWLVALQPHELPTGDGRTPQTRRHEGFGRQFGLWFVGETA